MLLYQIQYDNAGGGGLEDTVVCAPEPAQPRRSMSPLRKLEPVSRESGSGTCVCCGRAAIVLLENQKTRRPMKTEAGHRVGSKCMTNLKWCCMLPESVQR